MAPSAAAQTVVSGQVTGRKRKAEAAHSLVEMCLTSSRRAFLSFSWAVKLLQSPKRLKRIGGVLPWGGFNCMQHTYLHQAVIGAVKASDAAGGAPASHLPREAAIALGVEPQDGSRATPPSPEHHVEFVDLTLSDASDACGPASSERAHTSDGSVATMRAHRSASSQPASALWTSAPTAAATPAASPAFDVSEGGPSGSRAAGRGRGIPAALLVARAGTPHLSALRARRPQPKPSACVATTPTGVASNLQQLTAADMGRLLCGDGWLNDEVINFYVLLLMKREAESRLRSAATAAAAPPAPTPPAAVGVAGPNGRSPVGLACGSRTALGGAASASPAAAAARQQRRSHTPESELAPGVAGPCAKEGIEVAAVPGATGLQGATPVLGTTPLPALQLATPSPLKQVVSAVATAAGSSGAAAAAMMAAAVATTAAGFGAVVAAGAKHLAQRRRLESGCSAGAAPEAGTSSGPAPAPSEPSSSAPSGATSPPPLRAPQPHQAQQREAAASVYAFNSFFFSKLTGRGNRRCFDYREVHRWTRPERTRTADCVLQRDLLLFPINHGNSHWCLAAVWPRRRLLQYFDSLGGARSTADWVLDTLLRWLLRDAEDKGVSLGSVEVEEVRAGAAVAAGMEAAAGWRKESSQLRIPKQLDGCSCGVFVCIFAELLARGVPPNAFGFSQADLPAIRRGMAEQILRGSL